ncbi:MAG TPA: ABC transporter permease [archaeon]|nr:ABC transporter permease [archaeon]
MIDFALKNITRYRARTFLTVLGIVIGIAAIVALGSISEGVNTSIQSSLNVLGGKIMVQSSGSGGFAAGFAGSEITDEQVAAIESVDGIKEAVPTIFFLDTTQGLGDGQRPQQFVVGVDPSKLEVFVSQEIEAEDGRKLEEGDSGVILLGNGLAKITGLETGDTYSLKDEEDFEVVGVLEKSNNLQIDNSAIVPIKDLQDILKKDSYQVVFVIPENVENSENIVEDIEDVDEDLQALASTDIARQAGEISGRIRFFTLGVGAIAAVVGGLGVMNTMIMAVLERRREIGVLKALGATKRKVMVQFLLEASVISVLGGVVGVAVGFGASFFMGSISNFSITPVVSLQLVLGSLLFALVLGLVGGLYPSWKAARLDPVEALRYQ